MSEEDTETVRDMCTVDWRRRKGHRSQERKGHIDIFEGQEHMGQVRDMDEGVIIEYETY